MASNAVHTLSRMNAIKFEATIDEEAVRAIPALRPFLGKQIELIALDSKSRPDQDHTLTVDDLLSARLELPGDVGPLTGGSGVSRSG